MDLLEYELAGIVPVLLFFAFIWTAVLAGGILMIVLSARRKQKRLLRLPDRRPGPSGTDPRPDRRLRPHDRGRAGQAYGLRRGDHRI